MGARGGKAGLGDDSGPNRARHGGKWLVVAFLGLVGLGAVFVGALLVLKDTVASSDFRDQIRAYLEESTEADVTLDAVRSKGLIFSRTPSIWMVAKDRSWAMHMTEVKAELSLAGFARRAFEFRSLRIGELNLWVGLVPDEAPLSSGDVIEIPSPGRFFAWVIPARLRFASGGELEVDVVRAQGASMTGGLPAFRLEAGGSGSVSSGILGWKLSDGRVATGEDETWSLRELRGRLGREGIALEKGRLEREGGAVIELGSSSNLGGGTLEVPVTGSGLTFRPAAPGEAKPVGPVEQVTVDFTGSFQTQFPQVHRFRFSGDFHATGLQLGQSRAFELLASQTGEDALRDLRSKEATGHLEWTPGLVRLEELRFEEPDLVQLEGRISMAGPDLVGIFELSLPAALISRVPGGKPEGFSFPASGWSTAQIQVDGQISSWREDLTDRLVQQVSPNLGVAPAPAISDSVGGGSSGSGDAVLDRYEALFHELITP